jgi:hypothetical protein
MSEIGNVNIKPTSFEELKEYANGELLELPAFGPTQKFRAYVRRPSMLKMAKEGKIPNSLLSVAEELFTGTIKPNAVNESMLKDIYELCEILAKASFVNPTFDQLKEAGMELSDDQLMFIFNYSQRGVGALQPFRKE